MTTIQDILAAGKTSTDAATKAFDTLEVADIGFMLGRWKGSEVKTGNTMDGLLSAAGWYGKEFVDAEHVHPLLFRTGSKIRKLEPRLLFAGMGMSALAAKLPFIIKLFRLIQPLMQTRHSRARLRMVEYRGKISATMQYDNLPINDVFRKVDDDTVLGVMDLKGMEQPYYFALRREN